MSASPSAIRFYHVQEETPAGTDAVLPALLEKALAAGQKLLLVCPTAARQSRLDEALWTYNESSFLPHAAYAPDAESANVRQPILLSLPEDPLAGLVSGRLPLVLSGAETALPLLLQGSPVRLFYLFHAAPSVLEAARAQWKTLKAAGHQLEYWQQEQGRWQLKQSTVAAAAA